MPQTTRPKIAVIDLTLHYPPKGGACVDIFNTFTRLQSSFQIKLFGISWPSDFPRCQLSSTCPLPYEIITVQYPNRDEIISATLKALGTWQPALVFIADGWTLKPYIAEAVNSHYKTLLRMYSYEMLCPRTNERWHYTKDNPNIQCPNWALTDCKTCLTCATAYQNLIKQVKNGRINPLIEECNVADIWRGDYQKALENSFKSDAIIVYNSYLKEFISRHTSSPTYVVPGGVDLKDFEHSCSLEQSSNKPFTILVFGRMDAASKGADLCIQAGKSLDSQRIDFKLIITEAKQHTYPWLQETGWCSQKEIKKILQTADCVVVPSLWQEAFGMTWVEAMAMKVPVIASDVAGPREHITHGITGLLFPAGDSTALIDCIKQLITSSELRQALSTTAYTYVTENLTWDLVSQQTEAIINTVLKANG